MACLCNIGDAVRERICNGVLAQVFGRFVERMLSGLALLSHASPLDIDVHNMEYGALFFQYPI